jgi:hypothetical protein
MGLKVHVLIPSHLFGFPHFLDVLMVEAVMVNDTEDVWPAMEILNLWPEPS